MSQDLVIYRPGQTTIQTTVTTTAQGSFADYSHYQNNGVNMTVDEYLSTLPEGFKVMTFDDALDMIAAAEDHAYSKPFAEITAEQFDEALNCLPPENWQTVAGVNIFRMCEYTTSNITAHYATLNGRFFFAERRNTTSYYDIAREVAERMAERS